LDPVAGHEMNVSFQSTNPRGTPSTTPPPPKPTALSDSPLGKHDLDPQTRLGDRLELLRRRLNADHVRNLLGREPTMLPAKRVDGAVDRVDVARRELSERIERIKRFEHGSSAVIRRAGYLVEYRAELRLTPSAQLMMIPEKINLGSGE
jgi:hypothetical protein